MTWVYFYQNEILCYECSRASSQIYKYIIYCLVKSIDAICKLKKNKVARERIAMVNISFSILAATPVFTTPNPLGTTSIAIDEDTSIGTSIYTVVATDADSGSLTYAISPSSVKFSIDPISGELTTSDTLDFETTTTYSLTLQWVFSFFLFSSVHLNHYLKYWHLYLL